jgi:hypothetical protein
MSGLENISIVDLEEGNKQAEANSGNFATRNLMS